MIRVHAAAAKNIKNAVENKSSVLEKSHPRFRWRAFLKSNRWPFLAILLSSCLSILSFPFFECSGFAWVALIPLFFVLDRCRLWTGFWAGYGVGGVFFFGTLYWFIHVTLSGMILLNLYLAVYFGVFGWLYCFFSSRKLFVKLFLIPSLWVALEYLRGHLFTGFGWVCLGHSQYKNILLIQMCDITGMYGVSFVLVMVNFLLKEWFVILLRISNKNDSICFVGYSLRNNSPKPIPSINITKAKENRILPKAAKDGARLLRMSVVVLTVGIVCFGYGFYQLRAVQVHPGGRVAVVQGNIAQWEKWQQNRWPAIMEKYKALTIEAAQARPQLMIWPETAFPGFIWEAPQLFIDLKYFLAKLNTPLLLGVVTQLNEEYFNSAILLSKEGEFIDQYDKLHLVPFGEFVPLRNIFPFLSHIVPIGDFSAGEIYKVFDLWATEMSMARTQEKNHMVFSVLICFEDTVPELARKFTREGAQFLVNITNDAWFLKTPASLMHLQSAVFRTVENRRSLIRAANTGVSCFIDPWGRVSSPVQKHIDEKIFVDGISVSEVQLSGHETFYTKFGDVFAYLCFGCILWAVCRQYRIKQFSVLRKL